MMMMMMMICPTGLSAGLPASRNCTNFTYYASIHVGLLNLLSRDCFQESKWSKVRWRPGLCPGPGWESLQRSPDLLAELMEEEGRGKDEGKQDGGVRRVGKR